MPSIPKLKFKFKKGIHNDLLTNWKDPIDLLKKTHKNKEITYKKQETFKAIDFKNKWLESRTKSNKKVPIKGNIIRNTNKFGMFNKKKSNINILQDSNLCFSA